MVGNIRYLGDDSSFVYGGLSDYFYDYDQRLNAMCVISKGRGFNISSSIYMYDSKIHVGVFARSLIDDTSRKTQNYSDYLNWKLQKFKKNQD